MAEWSSVVVVVEAKSLALVCTKIKIGFVFLFGTKKNFFSQNPQVKKKKTQTNKKNPNKNKPKNWTPFRSLNQQLPNDFYTSLARCV